MNAVRTPDGAQAPIGLFCAQATAVRQLVLLLLMTLAVGQALLAGGITVLGTVRNQHGGQPISSASIQIFDRYGILLGSTSTNADGQWHFSFPLTVIGGREELPRGFALEQNYPNPFNPSTKLPFTIQKEGKVRITIYNILGQLVDGKDVFLRPGRYAIDWRANGGAGVLFYSIEMDGIRISRKMIQLDGGHGAGLGNISMLSQSASLQLSGGMNLDSCRVVASSLVYESDTLTIAATDSARADFLLETVHDHAFMMDLHNDVMEVISGKNFSYQLSDRHTTDHTDIPRLRDGGVDGQIFSIWIDPTKYAATSYFSTAMQFLDTLKAQARRNSGDMGLVASADSTDALTQQKKIAGVVVVEGGHCIEEKLNNLLAFYAAGVRVMTITWNNSTSWAVSAQDSRSESVGLNDFGKQVIRTMDSLGMIIDVSHVGRKTVEDILATSKNPIIASHSGAYALRNHYRNLTDSQIQAIAHRGGVIGVVFYPPFLVSSGTARLENVIQHIDYIKNLVGVDYVALGSDFDGIGVTPVGLEDVSHFPAITEALLQRGYSREDVRKILGGNFMRVFRSVCK